MVGIFDKIEICDECGQDELECICTEESIPKVVQDLIDADEDFEILGII